MADDRAFTVEALVRWRHPEHGPVSPARFVPEAERSGLVQDLDRFVRRRALAGLHAWRRAGTPVPVVAANLSAIELADPQLDERVLADVEAAAVTPASLALKRTETALM